MYDGFIQWVLSDIASILLAVLAFFLMILYLAHLCLTFDNFIVDKSIRKNRLLMRAINWGIFGTVFLLFGRVIPFQDLSTWRATARVALFFLMLPEMAYQITVIWPIVKRKGMVWTKTLHQSLLL